MFAAGILIVLGSSQGPRALADEPYRTPRAGEAVDRTVLGRKVELPARDRRTTVALDLGFVLTSPRLTGPRLTGTDILPLGAFFIFDRPHEDQFFEAVVAVVSNDAIYARSPKAWGPFELVGTFQSSTIPVAQAEIIDGIEVNATELLWGEVHGGFGVGYRSQVGPAVDNMLAVMLLVEPGFLYFDSGDETAPNFVVPSNTFELRARLRARFDLFERNLLEMLHSGVGFGAEVVFGYRTAWTNWGPDAANQAAPTRQWTIVRGYLQTATGLPFGVSERHRLLGSVHAGAGFGVDRFSAPRLGGGIESDQYRTVPRPLVPGAALSEFYPERYVVMLGEYRYELAFFSFIGLRGSASYLDRDRLGARPRESGWLLSLGTRLTTGFFFNSRLRVDYNYNFDVPRPGGSGGHELVLDISREF